MNSTDATDPPTGGSAAGPEMEERIRTFDWSRTPLGPTESWSPALRMMVRILLANRFPMLLWWGPEYVSLYNDSYRPILGTKHPWALGRPVRECWSEIWDLLEPLIDTPFRGGPATWDEDIFFEINRYGFVEETHFAIAYSAVPDESAPNGIGGVLAAVHEITEKVVGERRVRALRDLGARAGQARTAEEACRIAAETLAAYDKDVPFALLYLIDERIDENGEAAALAGFFGCEAETEGCPGRVELGALEGPWPFADAVRTAAVSVVGDLAGRFGGNVPAGPWSDPPQYAVMVPIRSNLAHRLAGVMVAGVSARLKFDEPYLGFYELLAGQIATSIANARAYEAERRRADALAEIDRAKTVFFSNVSHELRTPLTLILGPLEDALLGEADSVWPRERVEMLHRNVRRLQKLVNSLLDFARIEAGRIQATYVPTDLAELTVELASVFRSAVERAGMRLIVDCPPLDEPVYVDRDMYEKIVLNLVSNAFKFTLEGEIEVRLRDAGAGVELSVRDTGTGIAESHLPHVFDRFHRIEGVRARTHEGTGIGLAMVRELVRLHGGGVSVRSAVGVGSTFSVVLPKGIAHLPVDRIASGGGSVVSGASAASVSAADSFLEETLSWLPRETEIPERWPAGIVDAPTTVARPGSAERPRIVWADDNADMRAYVGRLLGSLYDVEVVSDGEAALAAVERRLPELVLADVMMPGLDGFGLLRALRSDERTRTLPVILLSARAGEEAHVEGMQAGADDYLVKPFSARELLARVGARLEMARLRRDHEARITDGLREADRRKDEFLATLAHELRNPLAPIRTGLETLRLARGDGEVAEQVHAVMERQVDHLIRLVDDLMEVSRITRGKVELKRERVDLADVVRSAVETSRPLIDASGHRLTLDLAPETMLLEADPVRLAQVLANLLNNAAKYTEDGGRIWLTAQREGAFAVVSVRDDGTGIDGDMLPSVFDLFAQGERSYGRSQGGLGIGLTLVRSLVDLHGGRVEAKSDGLGQGSEFVVRLPLAAGPAGSLQSDPPPALPPSAVAQHRILVVDDNHDAAESLGMLLRFLGADVRTARDGAEALDALETYAPSVVLLDIGLPGMDGYEVARRIRQRSSNDAVRVIALTGWGQRDDRRRSEEAGIDHHLVKPLDLAILERILATPRDRP